MGTEKLVSTLNNILGIETADKSPISYGNCRFSIRYQAAYIRKQVEALNLGNDIAVSNVLETRQADWFLHKKTLGLIGAYEIPLAAFASSGKEESLEPDCAVLYITPNELGSGLLVDNSQNCVWSDSFWVCEKGTIKYVRPSEPIPLDGIDRSFDSARRSRVLRIIGLFSDAYEFITQQKYLTAGILEENNIPIPRGIGLLPDDRGHTEEKYRQFIADNPHIKDIVIKPNCDSCGSGVMLLNTDTDYELIEYLLPRMDSQLGRGEGYVIEERIIPFPISRYSENSVFSTGGPYDYNFRVLVSVDPENPSVIDSEIRYRPMVDEFGETNPVNISVDAKAARMSSLGNIDLEEKVYSCAVKAVAAVAKTAEIALGKKAYGKSKVFLYSGVDLIFDQNENVYVFEVNGPRSGGFSTLCRLDAKPLASIRQKLLPAYMPALEASYAKRISYQESSLERLPYNENDIKLLKYQKV